MSRIIPNGAHVLVDPDIEPSNGSIVVAETEQYQTIMRRWFKGKSTLMLIADSFYDYEDIVFNYCSNPINVLGVVVWYQASKEME